MLMATIRRLYFGGKPILGLLILSLISVPCILYFSLSSKETSVVVQPTRTLDVSMNSVNGEYFARNRAVRGAIPKNVDFHLLVALSFTPVIKHVRSSFDDVFLRSLNYFWPSCMIKLNIVINAEMKDRERFATQWMSQGRSFNKCQVHYSPPSIAAGGDSWVRQQWMMAWADNFTTGNFVGFVEAFTLFTTPPLPGDMFEPVAAGGKPVIIAVYEHCANQDPHQRQLWRIQTTWILQRPAVMCCTSNAPVIFAVKHIVQLRRYVSEIHRTSFHAIFTELRNDVFAFTDIMCNYVWHFHQNAYRWHVQLSEYDWRSPVIRRRYASFGVRAEMTEPKPRIAINHALMTPPQESVDKIIFDGFCHFVEHSKAHARNRCPIPPANKHKRQSGGFFFGKDVWIWHPNTVNTFTQRLKMIG